MSNNINEDLKRFKSLLGYDPSKGNELTESKMRREAPGYRDYMSLNEAEPGEEEEENTDFDFGDEGNPEDAEGGETEGEGTEGGEFDFGDEGNPEDAEGGEEETDEFGTAGEFSAADELESEESDVEEIDVTSIVNKSDEAKEMAQQAVSVGQENMSYLKALTDKLSNLESQLTKMDSIASKITKLEQDIKTPEEKLELRSLDSYPFNMKLSDYWEEKAASNPHYKVTSGEEAEPKEYVVTPEDVEDFNPIEIQKSFVPESVAKKKNLKEQKLLNEGLSDIFRKFKNRKEEIKEQLSDEFGIEEGDSEEVVNEKLKNVLGSDVSESKLKRIAKRIGGPLGSFILTILGVYTTWKAVSTSPLGNEGDILAFFGYGISSYILHELRDKYRDRFGVGKRPR